MLALDPHSSVTSVTSSKTCTRCRVPKPLDQFAKVMQRRKNKTYGPYLDSLCKKCRAQATSAYRRRKRGESETVDGRKRYKPWSQAVRDLLADGEWHSWDEALKVGAALVPPGVAFRRSRRKSGDDSDAIYSGARDLCRQVVVKMIEDGHVEKSGQYLRFTQGDP